MIFDPLAPFPGYRGYVGNNPAIPNLYWNNHGNEERIARICRALHNVECYATDLGVQVNLDIAKINELGNTLEQLQNGGWFDEYAEQLEAWIRDITNLEQIAQDVLDDSGIPAAVTALETAVSGEGGLESRMTAAEGDIDALEATVSGEGGLESRMTAAEGDIDALEGRMGTAEADIDAEERARKKDIARALIPDTLHEAVPKLRYDQILGPTSGPVRATPQGATPFGGTPEAPLYYAVHRNHSIDTQYGNETRGSLLIYRLSDRQLLNTYRFEMGHGGSVSDDPENSRLLICEHAKAGVASPRVHSVYYDASGACTYGGYVELPFTLVQACGRYSDGGYWAWAPYQAAFFRADTLSTELSDWTKLFDWVQNAMGPGTNQAAFYTEELDLFGIVYSGATMIVFIAPDGEVVKTMQIDGALGWISVEELESAQMYGTVLWLNNACVYDNRYFNEALNGDVKATCWTVDLRRCRNYKDAADGNKPFRWNIHLGNTYAGLQTSDWTQGTGYGRVDMRYPRDLIAMKFYPQEKSIVFDTPFPNDVIPFISCGFVIINSPTNAMLVNSNICETFGGVAMYGAETCVNWFGWNTGTGIIVNDAAVANWPMSSGTSTTLKTWIKMRYFPRLYMRGATAQRTTSAEHTWLDAEDAILSWNSVSTKLDYMRVVRIQAIDIVVSN